MKIKIQPKSLLVLGDVILDHYTIGEVKRISPEAPVPIVLVKEEKITLGGAANVAHNLVGLKNCVTLLGATGQDQHGTILNQELKKKNIDNQCIAFNNYTTIFKNRIIAQRQQVLRIDYETKFLNHNTIIEHVEKQLNTNTFDMIILSDYGKGLCSFDLCKKIITWGLYKNIKTVVDPKCKNWQLYAGCFLITPNFKEFQEAVGIDNLANTDENIEKYAPDLRTQFDFTNIIITRSDKGMSLIEKQNITHFPVQVTEVFDVSGAGDTVVAVLTTCLSNDYTLKEACYYANIAAGYVISKMGTYAISTEDLNRSLS